MRYSESNGVVPPGMERNEMRKCADRWSGYFWIALIALFWAAVLLGGCSVDPRAPGMYRLAIADGDVTANLDVDAPAPYFVEPKYEAESIRTVSANDGATTTTHVRVSVGAEAEQARGFWGEAVSAIVGFIAGLFAA